jgi:hypothetical protein
MQCHRLAGNVNHCVNIMEGLLTWGYVGVPADVGYLRRSSRGCQASDLETLLVSLTLPQNLSD